MADRVGQQLGNYRLIRLLGRGGFAEVYLGQHLRLGTHAAIKVLYTRLANKDDVEGFEKEARTIAHLKHPHIVRILDYDVEEDTPFLVMDYAPGGTLRKRHPKGTRLPVATVVSSVKQVADALQYAHDRRVIHRDVKPENMLVGEHEELLLSDFGIAIVTQSSRYQSTREMAGTIAYMAPEQLQGKPRPASDQYALGITVYEWLCGDRPFHGTFTELYSQHLFVPPPPLHEKVPTIPPTVEQVVLTALAKDPHKRFANVQAFAWAFEQAYIPPSHLTLPTVAPVPSRSTPPEVISIHRPDQVRSQEEVVSQQPQQSVAETLHAIYDETSEKDVEPVPNLLTSATVMPTAQPSQPHDAASQQTTPAIHTPPRISEMPEILGRKRRLSRRKTLLILSLTGLTVTGIVGWMELTHRSPANSGNPSLKPTLKPGTTLYTYRGHTDKVNAVAWSPAGKSIASGGADETVQVWDAMTGNQRLTYRGHQRVDFLNEIFSVAWSPDGKYIASGSTDGTVQVWDAMTGNRRVTYTGNYRDVRSVAWSPDGKSIASGGINQGGGDQTIQVWDAMTGNRRVTYPSWTYSIAWSPAGKSIASGSAVSTVQVWDAMTGNTRLIYTEPHGDVYSVAWSPAGKSIASGGTDETVQVWQAV